MRQRPIARDVIAPKFDFDVADLGWKPVLSATPGLGSCNPTTGADYFEDNHCGQLGPYGYGASWEACDAGKAFNYWQHSPDNMRHTYTRTAACDGTGWIRHSRYYGGSWHTVLDETIEPNTVATYYSYTTVPSNSRRRARAEPHENPYYTTRTYPWRVLRSGREQRSVTFCQAGGKLLGAPPSCTTAPAVSVRARRCPGGREQRTEHVGLAVGTAASLARPDRCVCRGRVSSLLHLAGDDARHLLRPELPARDVSRAETAGRACDDVRLRSRGVAEVRCLRVVDGGERLADHRQRRGLLHAHCLSQRATQQAPPLVHGPHDTMTVPLARGPHLAAGAARA